MRVHAFYAALKFHQGSNADIRRVARTADYILDYYRQHGEFK